MRHIFIINNSICKQNASMQIREELKKRTDIDYLVFDTEYEHHETELVSRLCRIFDDEELRFYACGGSGTLANVVSGITNRKDTQIAFYPIGMSCDFLKCFDAELARFLDINALIDGDILKVDYINSDRQIVAMNTFSIGFDAGVVENLEHYRILSRINGKLTYFLAILHTLFQKRAYHIELEIDGEKYENRYIWMYAGNGVCCGSRYYPLKNAVPDDGMMDILLLKDFPLLNAVKYMIAIQKGEIETLGDKVVQLQGKKISVHLLENEAVTYDYDGDIMREKDITLSLIPNGVQFVVPKGVKVRRPEVEKVCL